jgi:hypothetical protein
VNYTSGATTATVTWSGDARSYNIDVNGTVTNGVSSPYTLGNLTPNTTYTIKVQSDCGDEQSGWAPAGRFTTPCGTYAIPYAYGFEDENDMTCWSMVNIPSDCEGITGLQTNAWAEYNFGDDYARSGNNFFFFYYYAYSSQGAPFQTLISPELSGISNGLHVEFYYSGYSNGIETFKVGYSTTDNDPDSFIWGNEITASSSYQRFSANYPAGTKYVAVQHTSDDQYYLFLDDFLFEESASILEPTGVQATDATTTGATISWTAGASETAWDIFVTDDATIEPDDNTTPTVAGTESNPYSLTNLEPCTIYYDMFEQLSKPRQALGAPLSFSIQNVNQWHCLTAMALRILTCRFLGELSLKTHHTRVSMLWLQAHPVPTKFSHSTWALPKILLW